MARDQISKKRPRIAGVILVAAPESGIESLTKLFSGLPKGLAASFVVAVPGYPGPAEKLREIIGQASGLDVRLVKQKDKLAPETIHILPAARIVTLE